MISAQPMDAVVLIGGCDKTVPAQLMGAASADLPAIQLVTGPMMTGRHNGQRLGACTDCRGFWGKFAPARSSADEIEPGRRAASPSPRGPARSWVRRARWPASPRRSACRCPARPPSRPCMPDRWSPPSRPAGRQRVDPQLRSGRPDHHPEIGRERVSRADGARRLDQRDRAPHGCRRAPGHPYVERPPERDFGRDARAGRPEAGGRRLHGGLHSAGGVGALLRELKPLLHLDTIDVTGRTLAERLEDPIDWVDRNVIRAFDDPVSKVGGLVALAGRWPRTARSSSAPRRRPRCSRRRVGPSSSPAWKTSGRIDDPISM